MQKKWYNNQYMVGDTISYKGTFENIILSQCFAIIVIIIVCIVI